MITSGRVIVPSIKYACTNILCYGNYQSVSMFNETNQKRHPLLIRITPLDDVQGASTLDAFIK